MNNKAFVNAANHIATAQAGLNDCLSELKSAYIADNRMLKHGQRIWVDGKLCSLVDVELIQYKQRVHLTYTLWPYVNDGSQIRRDGAAIELNDSCMDDWSNVSVEKP